jgi:hypothetical protein
MDREELKRLTEDKRLTEEEMGRHIREGVKAVIGQVLEDRAGVGRTGLTRPPPAPVTEGSNPGSAYLR